MMGKLYQPNGERECARRRKQMAKKAKKLLKQRIKAGMDETRAAVAENMHRMIYTEGTGGGGSLLDCFES